MRIIVAAFWALALAGCAQETADPAAEAEVAFESYVAALNDGRIESAANMYDDNSGFHWVERGDVQYTSGAEAAASLQGLYVDGGSALMTTRNVHVTALGSDSALVSAYFDLTLFDIAGDTQFSFDGWMTVGMVKRDGGWKIAGGQTGPGPEELQQ